MGDDERGAPQPPLPQAVNAPSETISAAATRNAGSLKQRIIGK